LLLMIYEMVGLAKEGGWFRSRGDATSGRNLLSRIDIYILPTILAPSFFCSRSIDRFIHRPVLAVTR
jgi:hypothetical protein